MPVARVPQSSVWRIYRNLNCHVSKNFYICLLPRCFALQQSGRMWMQGSSWTIGNSKGGRPNKISLRLVVGLHSRCQGLPVGLMKNVSICGQGDLEASNPHSSKSELWLLGCSKVAIGRGGEQPRKTDETEWEGLNTAVAESKKCCMHVPCMRGTCNFHFSHVVLRTRCSIL